MIARFEQRHKGVVYGGHTGGRADPGFGAFKKQADFPHKLIGTRVGVARVDMRIGFVIEGRTHVVGSIKDKTARQV